MSSDASPTPLIGPPHSVNYISFSAANPITVHLLESVLHSNSAPQTLICNKRRIGYQLQIPPLFDDQDTGDLTWQVGAGSIVGEEALHREPDILLCPPGETPGSELARGLISPIHASLYFVQPGALVLRAHCDQRSIIYEQGGIYDEDVKLQATGREKCVMRRTRNFLRFGDYRFVLEFISKDGGQANSNVQANNTTRHDNHGLYYPLVSAPMVYCATSYNVWLHPIPHTSRTSGVNIYTGEPVAVITLQNNKITQKARNLLRIACQYSDKPHKGVLGVVDVWCQHRRLDLSYISGLETFLPCCLQVSYSTPLAKYNFRNMEWPGLEHRQLLLYFYQTLLGLSELHQKDTYHGRITPESLLLVENVKDATPGASQPPLLRAFLSLPIDTRGRRTASVCVAPEIWKTETAYLDKFKADVWSLAASWLFAFIRPRTARVDQDAHRTLQLSIDKRIQEPLAGLLHQMLAFRPQDRPSAVEVLEHELWQPFRENRRRKRLETMEAYGAEPKKARKVRVLSPE